MSTSNSLGRFTQSNQAKEICIFLVNDDHICRNIVSNMLDHCCFEVFCYKTEMDALDIIREKKDMLEIILTNVQRTYADRYGIIHHIEKEFKLQIIPMTPDVDDVKKVEEGGNGVTVYIIKSLTANEVYNLWANAMAQEKKGKREISSGKLAGKTKRETSEENVNLEKKPRINWTNEMHQKFLEAVDQLGHDKAFPKKIVELMNVKGLTRENVASHLQKYRLLLKRTQEGYISSSYGFTDPFDPFGFNTLQTNYQESSNPFRIRSRNTTPSLLGLNLYDSRLRTIPNMPLLSTIQIKPERSFRVCSDEKKNILLSIEESNARFVGFRLSRDGKSIRFGPNGQFGIDNWIESCIQEEGFCPEMGNDDYTLHLEREYSASSIAGLLGVDDSLTEQQPPPPSTVAPPWTTWEEAVKGVELNQPSSSAAGLQWADSAELPGFSSQQPPSGNDVNANVNSEIFSDFMTSCLPLEVHELGTGIDENEMDVFDDLLFDNQDLT